MSLGHAFPVELEIACAKYGINKFSLNDRGYIAGAPPLELWTVNYLRAHPEATEGAVQAASRDARIVSAHCEIRCLARIHGGGPKSVNRFLSSGLAATALSR